MKYKELTTQTAADWAKMLKDAEVKLRELRFKDANKQLKDVRELRETKKLIARLLTLLNKK